MLGKGRGGPGRVDENGEPVDMNRRLSVATVDRQFKVDMDDKRISSNFVDQPQVVVVDANLESEMRSIKRKRTDQESLKNISQEFQPVTPSILKRNLTEQSPENLQSMETLLPASKTQFVEPLSATNSARKSKKSLKFANFDEGQILEAHDAIHKNENPEQSTPG